MLKTTMTTPTAATADITQDQQDSADDQPPSRSSKEPPKDDHTNNESHLFSWLKSVMPQSKNTESESFSDNDLTEYINSIMRDGEQMSYQEKLLITNTLKLRDLTVLDVMIPRVDIAAIDIQSPQEELLQMLAEKQYSRLPVYRETLDDVLGTIHIKDILASLAAGQPIDIQKLLREVPIISPAMPVLDLLLEMQESRKHLALVVDEYGGIDGLVTIGDILEAIIGELEDEHDDQASPELKKDPSGLIYADARVSIEEFETLVGDFLTDEERDDIDTLGGLLFSMAGRVPARGEILTHETGLIFEIVEADPRRVRRMRIRTQQMAAE